jgi:hypothetical protein
MVIALVVLVVLAACGDDLEPAIPTAAPLPACADLGCPLPTQADRVCSATGACSCRADRTSPAVACAPDCAELGCVALSCGNLTPAGDTDPTACTCEIEAGGYVACRAI